MQYDAPDNLVPQASEAFVDLHLRDLFTIVRMQWKLVALAVAACLLFATVYLVTATRLYSATASIHLSAVTGQELKVDKLVEKDVYNRIERRIFTQTQVEIIESRSLREEVLERYHALGYDDFDGENASRSLLSAMAVVPRRNSEIIDIRVTHADPERATVLANLIAETYRDANLGAIRDSALEARQWLEKQLNEYEDAIRDATKAKLEYQASADLADADEVETTLSDQLQSLNQAHGEVNTRRVQLASALKTHETMLRTGEVTALAKEFDTPLITKLNETYGAVVTEAAAIASRYGAKHPERQRVEAELTAIGSELEAEVRRQVQAERATFEGLKEREAGLTAEIVSAKERLLDWHERHEAYQKLAMELDRKKSLYEKLSNRRHELDFVASTQLNNVRMVDDAVAPRGAVHPKVLLTLVFGGAAGLGIGLVLALFREVVDDSIATPVDVQAWLDLPTLGVLPRGETSDRPQAAFYTDENPTSVIAEAMRGVRTVIEMNPKGESLGRILVTSAVAGEGKTSISTWLAVAFAQLGRRVVLVDCDLRRPKLHTSFGLPREGGVTDVLIGDVEDPAIHDTRIRGLHVLTAGPRSSHAVETLGSPVMAELIQRLEHDFDLVILDTPPSAIVSDAQILSRHVDGVVYVVRAHHVSRQLARSAVEGLRQVGANVLGSVINAVDASQGRARYYYGSSYGYGYGYGYEEEPEVPAPAK